MWEALNRSLPLDRVIDTRQASPSLASQAPNVSIINKEYSSYGYMRAIIIIIIKSVDSRASRAMSKCIRWVIIAVIVARAASGASLIKYVNIAWGIYHSISGLQDQRWALASQAFSGYGQGRLITPKVIIFIKLYPVYLMAGHPSSVKS